MDVAENDLLDMKLQVCKPGFKDIPSFFSAGLLKFCKVKWEMWAGGVLWSLGEKTRSLSLVIFV